MGQAEGEKLNLLREHRLSQERFYYQLAILSGGTASLFVTLLGVKQELVDNILPFEKWVLFGAVILILISFILSIVRNRRAPSAVKDIACDENTTEYRQILDTLSKEQPIIKILSSVSVWAYMIGLVGFVAVVALSIFI